jgi:hypothetical protein
LTTPVTFFRGPTRRYRSELPRGDGVLIELEGGSYNQVGVEVPHDIAHLVVEDELGLDRGVFGVLVAGGLFRGATMKAGRKPPHAEKRAREILDGSREHLNQVEVVVRAVADMALAGASADPAELRRRCGERYAVDATSEQLERAFARLREYGAAWARIAPGESLTLEFKI